MLISKGSRFSFKLPYLFSRLFINLLPYSRIYTLLTYLSIYFLPSLFSFFLSFFSYTFRAIGHRSSPNTARRRKSCSSLSFFWSPSYHIPCWQECMITSLRQSSFTFFSHIFFQFFGPHLILVHYSALPQVICCYLLQHSFLRTLSWFISVAEFCVFNACKKWLRHPANWWR